MSDETEDQVAALNHFFTTKAPNARCPCCGSEKWTLVANPGMEVAIVMKPKDRAPALSTLETFSAEALLCQICGFIRLHARDFIKGRLP